jgi:hypothetical protein
MVPNLLKKHWVPPTHPFDQRIEFRSSSYTRDLAGYERPTIDQTRVYSRSFAMLKGWYKLALKWWQIEWIATILSFEDTEEETVRHKKNGCPDQDSQLLTFDILHPGNFQCECDRGER